MKGYVLAFHTDALKLNEINSNSFIGNSNARNMQNFRILYYFPIPTS